ncbi:MAG: hypothetical protein MHM6MM_002252 [Cercozoa sp. M6MM]
MSQAEPAVQVTKVRLNSYVSRIDEPIEFRVWFTAATKLPNDMDWRIEWSGGGVPIVLEELSVGVPAAGKLRFVISGKFPIDKVPQSDIFDMSVLSVVGTYCGHEFMRIGYYMRHDYKAGLANLLPQAVDWSLAERVIADKYKVTQRDIPWTQQEMNQDAYYPPMSREDALLAQNEAEQESDQDDSDDYDEGDMAEDDEEDFDPNAEYSLEDIGESASTRNVGFAHFNPPAAVSSRNTQQPAAAPQAMVQDISMDVNNSGMIDFGDSMLGD